MTVVFTAKRSSLELGLQIQLVLYYYKVEGCTPAEWAKCGETIAKCAVDCGKTCGFCIADTIIQKCLSCIPAEDVMKYIGITIKKCHSHSFTALY